MRMVPAPILFILYTNMLNNRDVTTKEIMVKRDGWKKRTPLLNRFNLEKRLKVDFI